MNYEEQPEAALRRELREETGLELENVKMIRVRTIKRHIEILFQAEAKGKAEVKSHEISDVGWFGAGNLPENLSEPQRRMILDILNTEF